MKAGLLNNKNAQEAVDRRDARVNLRVFQPDKNIARSKSIPLIGWIECVLSSVVESEESNNDNP